MDNFNEKLLGCCPIAKENPIDLDKSGLRSKKLEDGDHERLVDFIMEEFVFDERMAFVSSKSKEKLGEDFLIFTFIIFIFLTFFFFITYMVLCFIRMLEVITISTK